MLQLVVSEENKTKFLDATEDGKKEMMKKFGLRPHQYNAVLSGELEKILTVLSEEYGPTTGDFMMP